MAWAIWLSILSHIRVAHCRLQSLSDHLNAAMHGRTEEIHVLSIMGINNTVACEQTSNAAEVLRGETAMGGLPPGPHTRHSRHQDCTPKERPTVEEEHNQLNAQFPHGQATICKQQPRSPLRVHNLFLCSSSCVSDVVVDIHSWQFHQFLRSTRVVWPKLGRIPVVHQVLALGVITLRQIPHLFMRNVRPLISEIPRSRISSEALPQVLFLQPSRLHDDLHFTKDCQPLSETFFQFDTGLRGFANMFFEIFSHRQKTFFSLMALF